MISLALLLALGSPPDDATLVYYNARLALREGDAKEALDLWLLRNAIAHQRDLLSPHDADFVSVTWVALGSLGVCPDGLDFDREGAGLWPLALHNWFLRTRRRPDPPSPPSAYDAFEIGQQKRYISVTDVLSAEELGATRFFATRCYRMKDVLADAGQGGADPARPEVSLAVIENLLGKALATLDPDRVRGRALVQARLLDIELQKILQYERAARRRTRRDRRDARRLEVELEPGPEPTDTEGMRRLLAPALAWTADDWLALEPARRRFLYDRVARAAGPAPTAARRRLEVIDRLIAARSGAEVATWIAYTADAPEARRAIWSGDRGRALLGLDDDSGFSERAAIALFRAVDQLGAGDRSEALRNLAFALHHARASREGERIRRLSLRWLAYVAGQYEVTDELMAMLVQLVPRGDLSVVLEDLLWEAAFRADAPSFARIEAAQRGRGALRARVDRLRPLAAGDVDGFVRALAAELADTPYAALRFSRRLLDRLQREDGDTRARHRGTLDALRRILVDRPEEARVGSLGKKAEALDRQAAAILEGLPAPGGPRLLRDRAGALAPTTEAFAGRVRLAPSDPLPWPFPRPRNLPAPSVLTPVPLTPLEWTADGRRVLGWRLGR